MKKRVGFVANSSSHTFILYASIALYRNLEYKELIEKNFEDRLYLNETELLAGLNSILGSKIPLLRYEKYPENFALKPEINLEWETHVSDYEYSSRRPYTLQYRNLLKALDSYRRKSKSDLFGSLLVYQLVGETDEVVSCNPDDLENKDFTPEELEKQRYNWYYSRNKPRYIDTINFSSEKSYRTSNDIDFNGYSASFSTIQQYQSYKFPDEFLLETKILNIDVSKLRFRSSISSKEVIITGIFSNNNVCLKSYSSFSDLEVLIICNAKLQEIPEFVFTLEKLRILILNNNQIKAIPAKINQMKNLKTLYLHNNDIHEVPVLSIPLRILGLTNNKLTHLPSLQWQELEKLYIDGNPLIWFDHNEIENMNQILRLDIDSSILQKYKQHFDDLIKGNTSIYDETENQWGITEISERFFDKLNQDM
ncbi:MAG: leucine-rich repeat domain-containing protein [Candidatus Heimdallarchaeota archaeon]|nr:leucine-rich repeat domain-containing protein [Candidatus Heimdallarchaeota archaeon]